MIALEEAQQQILDTIRPWPAEAVALADALGRFLAVPVHSPVDLPPADNSAMDGYAVRAADLAAASAAKPVSLALAGESPAGGADPGVIAAGACARIFTGARLPRSADAVVMQEDVKLAEGDSVKIIFFEPVKPWENVRLRGEDVRRGVLLAAAGERLTAQRLALLSGAGIASVQVARRPVIGLLATGDELSEPGHALQPGQIYESNRAGLAALTRQAGAVPKTYPLVPDDLQLTQGALLAAFQECDAVVTSGGASVGAMDWIKAAFEQIGGQLGFWKVEIRPGKPFAFGRREDKLLFGLPGNPVSAMVTFFLLVRPALLKWQGASELRPPVSWGKLAAPLANPGERRHFMRVTLGRDGHVKSAGSQASHMLSSLAAAEGLVDVAPGTTLPAGALVPVMLWGCSF